MFLCSHIFKAVTGAVHSSSAPGSALSVLYPSFLTAPEKALELNAFRAASICALLERAHVALRQGPANLLCSLHPTAVQGDFSCLRGARQGLAGVAIEGVMNRW